MKTETETEVETGSSKLMAMLAGGKTALSPDTMAKAFGVKADQLVIDRWWIKGQPRPDIFWANLRIRPELVGELAGQFIKGGLVVEGFPLGKPGVIDMAGLNVSNLPSALR
jgi:hypothetical protein